MSDNASNVSLAERLREAEMYDEFCALMFDQGMQYTELLAELEKWSIYSSLGALSRFKQSHRGPWAMARARRQYESILNDEGIDMDDAERKLVAQRLYQDAANPETSTKDVLRMRDQHLGAAKLKLENQRLEHDAKRVEQAQKNLELAERKIVLLEAKMKEAAEVIDQADVSEQDKIDKMRAIFGR